MYQLSRRSARGGVRHLDGAHEARDCNVRLDVPGNGRVRAAGANEMVDEELHGLAELIGAEDAA